MGYRRRMMNKKEIVYGNGVYIEATNGKLFTASKWTGNLTPNSVVVISSKASFRIALTHSSSTMLMSSSWKDRIETYLTSITNKSLAYNDMNAVKNTNNILKSQPSPSYAAGYCNSFVFPDNKTTGVLPSLGWWKVASEYKSEVDTCLSVCNATPISSENHFSSTFYDVSKDGDRVFWSWVWSKSNGFGYGTYAKRRIRAFAVY